jgi:hypothetical protein
VTTGEFRRATKGRQASGRPAHARDNPAYASHGWVLSLAARSRGLAGADPVEPLSHNELLVVDIPERTDRPGQEAYVGRSGHAPAARTPRRGSHCDHLLVPRKAGDWPACSGHAFFHRQMARSRCVPRWKAGGGPARRSRRHTRPCPAYRRRDPAAVQVTGIGFVSWASQRLRRRRVAHPAGYDRPTADRTSSRRYPRADRHERPRRTQLQGRSQPVRP